MSLTSFIYLAFLSVCVILYNIMPYRFRNHMLLLASVAFYAYAMPKELLIMMTYIWVIFVIGLCLHKAKHARIAVIAGILVSVGFLFAYKYLNFTLSFFTHNNKTFSLVAPIGISYVTFQCIAYLVEVYKKKTPVVHNPIQFFLYCLFFTKITAGPIEPPAKFLDTIQSKRPFSWKKSKSALLLIAIGFAKKLVVADMLSASVAAVFDASAQSDGLSALLAAIMYSIQIYFDFSGYTDIARGSSLLFGIDLTENFKNPYLATSVVDFWRRWHISLSEWLKQYIYIPLGGSRCSKVRRFFNVFMTFLVSGIWHGASLTFIFWGVLHGVFQILEMLVKPVVAKVRSLLRLAEDGIVSKVIGCIKTFVLVTFAWIFFRANSFADAMKVIKGIFTQWATISESMSLLMIDIKTIILITITALTTILLKRYVENAHKIKTWAVIITCATMFWLVFISYMLAPANATSSFIYFNF